MGRGSQEDPIFGRLVEQDVVLSVVCRASLLVSERKEKNSVNDNISIQDRNIYLKPTKFFLLFFGFVL